MSDDAKPAPETPAVSDAKPAVPETPAVPEAAPAAPEPAPTAPEPAPTAPEPAPAEQSAPEPAPESTPKSTPEPAPQEPIISKAPVTEFPAELKTIHESPLPLEAPITQEDDAPKDKHERHELLKRAILFLETGTVADAPVQEKQDFLRSKGLTPEEAEELIEKTIARQKRRDGKKAAKNKERSLVRQQAPEPAPQQPRQQQVQKFQPQPPQQTPTIVTYPEWLAPAPAPPRPLVTGATLAKALYFGAATAATVYGANQLLVTPMLDALTAARLDLSATVGKNLDELNERLLELAPTSYVVGKSLQRPRDDDEESIASDISDPGELFHVDANTQTDDLLTMHGEDEGTGAMTPDSKLEELTSQMRVLVESHSDGTDNELTFLLEDLTRYLEGLSYDSSIHLKNPFPGFGQSQADKDDPITKVKQEIRSVKGVLLNTKNFPAGR